MMKDSKLSDLSYFVTNNHQQQAHKICSTTIFQFFWGTSIIDKLTRTRRVLESSRLTNPSTILSLRLQPTRNNRRHYFGIGLVLDLGWFVLQQYHGSQSSLTSEREEDLFCEFEDLNQAGKKIEL